MQPNDQQGYVNPQQGQPAQPAAGPQPVQPIGGQPIQPIDPTAMQAALNEPGPVPPQPPVVPVSEQQLTEEEFDDGRAPAEVTWVAHEYIHQEKGTTWFILFIIVIAALLAVSIFLMQSWSFAVLLAVISVVIVVYSRRPPRELTYAITDDGLQIDQTLHKFTDFKSFGIIRDGEEFSVMLIPVKRFQPGITVYFPEESGEAIVDLLGARLPMKDLKLDAVDRVVRLLRL